MNSRSGITTIALVVAISLALAAIITTIQAITLLNVRLAQSSISEKSTFYAAEGIIYDALVRMNASYDGANYTWPPSATMGTPEPLPSLNNIDIVRTISETATNYQIDVTAGDKNSSRRLRATITKDTGGAFPPTDIVLVIDHSAGMANSGTHVCDSRDCTTENVGWVDTYHKNLNCSIFSDCELISQPIRTVGSAAQYFVDLVRNNTNQTLIQTGYIDFWKFARVRKELNNDHNTTYQYLKDSVVHHKWRNLYDALDKADGLWTWTPPNNNKKVIILFTGGLPDMYGPGNPPAPNCDIPDDSSNDQAVADYQESNCFQDPITKANTLKDKGVLIYTIGLGLANANSQTDQTQINLAKSLLDAVSSSPSTQYSYYTPAWDDWTSESTLHDVYAKIFQNIQETPYLNIEELAPE